MKGKTKVAVTIITTANAYVVGSNGFVVYVSNTITANLAPKRQIC